MTSDEAIQLFLPGGDPSGLKIISIPASWNGRAFRFSRGDVGQIKNRKAKYTHDHSMKGWEVFGLE